MRSPMQRLITSSSTSIPRPPGRLPGAQPSPTLSLIPYLTSKIVIVPEKTVMVINYGTDKVRFLESVKVGSAVRARVLLADASGKGSGRMLFKTKVTVEIKDNEKPALVAETLMLAITEVPA